ncbi:hypothetical protein ZOSMA_203G00060 [Zostera marina]|uniref:Uncharacterized protein n=1 Tax=Zostera marina TaxID=29655 RepID=A0A0K9PLN9_ZOSMR|nr:hypothetical protein ZOSMA_203G00060 [Zostera marina]
MKPFYQNLSPMKAPSLDAFAQFPDALLHISDPSPQQCFQILHDFVGEDPNFVSHPMVGD